VEANRNGRSGHTDWEAIFHGRERRINTVIIGIEADFQSRSRMSREEVAKLIRALKEDVNLSYAAGASRPFDSKPLEKRDVV
jgi:RNase H-fold protein (predicted Holliday junction resolvase)